MKEISKPIVNCSSNSRAMTWIHIWVTSQSIWVKRTRSPLLPNSATNVRMWSSTPIVNTNMTPTILCMNQETRRNRDYLWPSNVQKRVIVNSIWESSTLNNWFFLWLITVLNCSKWEKRRITSPFYCLCPKMRLIMNTWSSK